LTASGDDPEGGPEDPDGPAEEAIVEWPIDGTLDLHLFDPAEVGDLVPEYLRACRDRGILKVRLVHGKGTGALRRTVESLLDRLPEVAGRRTAGEDSGGWGATVVTLHPL
jgi:DNA-nicking Smr family endonuclease